MIYLNYYFIKVFTWNTGPAKLPISLIGLFQESSPPILYRAPQIAENGDLTRSLDSPVSCEDSNDYSKRNTRTQCTIQKQ